MSRGGGPLRVMFPGADRLLASGTIGWRDVVNYDSVTFIELILHLTMLPSMCL